MSRILGLDVGRRRIGLAIATSEHAPQGLDALVRRTLQEDVARLARIAAERRVERFIVGLPLNMDGSEGEMARFVRAFGLRLEQETGNRVTYQDERLTSVEAEGRMKEAGMSLKRMLQAKRKGAVDRLAAVILLEDYLRGAGACE